jgi:O-antigen ligase
VGYRAGEKGDVIIYRLLIRSRQVMNRYSAEEWLILGLVLSLFISIYATIAGMILVLGYLIKNNLIGKTIHSTDGYLYLMLFFPLTLVVSLSSLNMAGVLLGFVIAAVFLISMFVRTVMNHKLFIAIIKLSCIGSLFSFLVVLWQLLGERHDISSFRPSSTFINANFYAVMTVIVILFCFYRLATQGQGGKTMLVLTIAVNMAGLYFCNSRSAIVALGVAILAFLLAGKRYLASGIVLAVLLLLVSAVCLMPELLPRTSDISRDLAVRQSIWTTALRGIVRHPLFGQGSGTYLLTYKLYGGPMAKHAHNLFLDTILNFGFGGTLLLVLYFKDSLRPLVRMQRNEQDQQRSCLVIAIICATLIHGITDVAFFGMQTGVLLSISMAFATGSSVNCPEVSRIREQPGSCRVYDLPGHGVRAAVLKTADAGRPISGAGYGRDDG